MKDSKPLVIVLSRNYSTGLGIIRSLGKAGYTVDLIASTKKKGSSVIASGSKYVRKSVEVITPDIQRDTGAELLKEIMKYTEEYTERMVLFPVDDFTASVVDSNRQLLKEFFFIPQISCGFSESITEVMNKNIQGKIAEKAGLLIPKEWNISLSGELLIPKDICYPCFVKPIQSISGSKTEMKVCRDEDELEEHLYRLKIDNSKREILVQQYLHIDKEYDLSGVCLDQNVIIPGIIEKTRIARYEMGVTMCGKTLPTDVLGDELEKITEFLKSLHYMGMFDMELFLCGNNIYFNEVNFRSGGPNYSYFLNGVNLPDIYVKEISGQGHDREEEIITEFGKTFIYEKVAWEDYIHSFMTRKELKKCMDEADFYLLNDNEDLVPGRLFEKRIRLSAAKHKIHAVKQKEKVEKAGVVIVGCNYCNILTMVRALGKAGYTSDVLRVYKKKPGYLNILSSMEPEAHSKYVNGYHKCIVNGNKSSVIEMLMRLAAEGQQKLLVPVDDYTACIVDTALEELGRYYMVPNVSDRAMGICQLMDKNTQKGIAAKYDLPMLESVLITSEDGEFQIPDTISYPCFIKPNMSMKSTKAKMTKCNNREELQSVLQRYAKTEDFEMLVEQFADIRAEYSVLGVCTGEVCIAPGIFRVLKGGHRERKGVTITGESVSAKDFKEIIDKCTEFIKGIHYTGLFDVDLIETVDGKVYFIELNFRAGASIHLFTETGNNLPGMFADYMLKKIPVETQVVSQNCGKRFVSEKVLLEEFARNDMGIRDVRRCMDEADVYFIKDAKDSKPYQFFRKYFLVAALLRFPYKLRDLKRGE